VLANPIQIGAGSGVASLFDLPADGSGDLTFNGQATLNGTLASSATITVTGGTLTLRGGLTEVVGSQNFTKSGSGTLVLGGVVNNTGTITYSGGALVLDRSLGGVFSNANWPLGLTNTNFTFKGASTGTSTQGAGEVSFTARTGLDVIANGGTGTTLSVRDTWTRAGGSTLTINLSGNAALAASRHLGWARHAGSR
jgi:hypothetical protein